MNPCRKFVLMAGAILLLAGIACDASAIDLAGAPTPTPSGPPRYYLASDKAGAHETTSFSTADTIYLLIDARGLPPGVIFDAKWYGLTLAAVDPNIALAFQTVSHDGISPTVEVWFGSKEALPAGQYRVDVYENGNKIGSQVFTVR